tara:strand:+ start:655 stop:1026 length:372 start_codon:yes stop_codon:yes gene_type:complete
MKQQKFFLLINLLTISLLINGCSTTKKSPYDRYTTNKSEMAIEIANLSSATDNNICRLAEISQDDMRSNEIQKRISKGVEAEIERRELDCSEPFPQKEDQEDLRIDENKIREWFRGMTNSGTK